MLIAQAEELVSLIKLLPNGAAVIAVIVVVVLFLKQQDKVSNVLEQITDKFNDQTINNQKAFQDQINVLAQQYYTNQKSFQDQIQHLIDAHLQVSRETISALKALEATVNEVKTKVHKLP